jgi:predicted nucleic acid-binding protein
MRYWDSSALMSLLVTEATSPRMEELLRDDPAMVTWWGTPVECVSALARLEREAALTPDDLRAALERLRQASLGWVEVPATADVRDQAIRLLRVHRLRAADALQLAAAVVASDFQASAFEFVTLDTRQADAAEREGFAVQA